MFCKCQINAPGEQAVVFIDPLQWLPFTKSNRSWSCRRLLRSTQVKGRLNDENLATIYWLVEGGVVVGVWGQTALVVLPVQTVVL